MGLHVEGITFRGLDMYQLLQMKDGELRERLGVLYTRFAPFLLEDCHDEN